MDSLIEVPFNMSKNKHKFKNPIIGLLIEHAPDHNILLVGVDKSILTRINSNCINICDSIYMKDAFKHLSLYYNIIHMDSFPFVFDNYKFFNMTNKDNNNMDSQFFTELYESFKTIFYERYCDVINTKSELRIL